MLNFDPWEALGERDQTELTRRFETHYRANCEQHPFGVNMTGIYITVISGLIALFGWHMLLLAAGTDQRRFGEMTNRYASWMQQYYDALAKANVPVVMMHDDVVCRTLRQPGARLPRFLSGRRQSHPAQHPG